MPVMVWNSDLLWSLIFTTTGFCTCSGSGQTPDLQQYSDIEWTCGFFVSCDVCSWIFSGIRKRRRILPLQRKNGPLTVFWMILINWLIDWQELRCHYFPHLDTFSCSTPLILWAVWRMLCAFWLVPYLNLVLTSPCLIWNSLTYPA